MYTLILLDGQLKRCSTLDQVDSNLVDWENTVLIAGYRSMPEKKYEVVRKAHKLLRDMEYCYNEAVNQKSTVWNQGQPLDGISELNAYREIAEQAIKLLKEAEACVACEG